MSWRCTVRQCISTIQTNSKVSNILKENENIFHSHNTVKNRDVQRQIVCIDCKRSLRLNVFRSDQIKLFVVTDGG